jgi:CysZ protein
VGALARFFAGVGYLGQGLRLWARSPRLMLLGAIPALVVGAGYTAAIVVFAMHLPAIAAWLTPFASGWDDTFRILTRLVAAIAVSGLALIVALFTYTAITLMVGDPFYERIWRRVEERAGNAPPGDQPFWPSLARGIRDGLRLLVASAVIGLVLFAAGFIPLVGQTVVPVLGALAGGWFLAVELTGFAFDARGLSLADRRRMLGADRAGALGFGVATYLLFLVPLGAVVSMPAAVAGATLLSRATFARSGTVPAAR